jgi:hypothetical protein
MSAEPALSQQLRDALAEQVRIGLRVPTSLIVKATASLDDLERQLATAKTEPASGWARQVSLESIKGYLGPARRGILSDREWLKIIERLHQLWISKESEAAQEVLDGKTTMQSSSETTAEPAPAPGQDAYPQERVDAVTQAGIEALLKNRDHPDFSPGLALTVGGVCAKCGFTYREYRGHIIPCPVCECASLRAVAKAAKAFVNGEGLAAARLDRALVAAVRALERGEIGGIT